MKLNNNFFKFFVIICLSICAYWSGSQVNAFFDLRQQGLEARLREEILRGIKDQLSRQIDDEMRQLVKQEVERELGEYLVKIEGLESLEAKVDSLLLAADGSLSEIVKLHGLEARIDSLIFDDKLAFSTDKIFQFAEPESKQDAVKRIVQEIMDREMRRVLDEDLDKYVAGAGIKPDFSLPHGLSKPLMREEFQLAAAADTQSTGQHFEANNNEGLDEVVGGAERAESIERTLQTRGGILLPKGQLQFEPSLTWAHFSSNRINIQGFSILPVLVIGQISTETVTRDVAINTYSFKYGLFNNLQVDAKAPYRYEKDRITDTFNNETTRNDHGLGDVELGISRQIAWEKGMIPDLVASINVKTPTGGDPYNTQIGLGTGHYAVRAALIAAKSSDPAVVFGGLNYTHSLERDIDNFGTMQPGDVIGWNIGTAIALSYQTAINFAFDNTITLKLTQNGRRIPDSLLNSATAKIGFNWAFNEKASLDIGVGIGLTDDSPDVSFDMRVPYLF